MAKFRSKPNPKPIHVAALLEQVDDQYLIVRRAEAEVPRRWQFPRGPAAAGESPEEAMRRTAREQLGVEVDIVIGQPPLAMELEGRSVELRYFFCALIGGTMENGPYAELRWIPVGQLREYEFDAASQPVVDWLLSGG